MNKYVKLYKWSNIFAMLSNQRKEPKQCHESFHGRLLVITGATSGIGLDAAKKYASCGCDILMINRNEVKSKQVCEQIKQSYHVVCSYLIADFSSLEDTHRVGKQLSELNRDIDVLIHNAGVYLTKKTITDDGLEMCFQTNYLSSFILNHYVKDKLMQQPSARILYVNSEAHRFSAWGLHMDDLQWEKRKYSGLLSYGSAKLAQLLSMIVLDEYFAKTSVTINAMHPGNVKTNSGKTNGKVYSLYKKLVIDGRARSIKNSSESLYYLGVCSDVQTMSGKFFNLTTLEEPAPPALDLEEAKKLWNISMKLGGLSNEKE